MKESNPNLVILKSIEEIPNCVLAIRDYNKFDHRQASRVIKIRSSTWSAWEKGIKSPRIPALELFCLLTQTPLLKYAFWQVNVPDKLEVSNVGLTYCKTLEDVTYAASLSAERVAWLVYSEEKWIYELISGAKKTPPSLLNLLIVKLTSPDLFL